MGGAPTETNEAALLTRPGGQLYAVLGQRVPSADGSADRYQLRLWWKPPVWWIWLGRSEEHTSELQSLMRISYAVFCMTQKQHKFDMLHGQLQSHQCNSHH